MFSMIPLPYKLIAIGLLIIGAAFYGYTKGKAYAEAELQKFAAEKNAQVAELERINSEISNNVQVEYVDRVNTIREKEYVYRDIAQNNVPSQYDMSNGWVYTHDLSATSGNADPTRASDASPSGIKDNTALLTVISNYSTCMQNSQQLASLQQWVNDNKRAVDEMAAKEKKKK